MKTVLAGWEKIAPLAMKDSVSSWGPVKVFICPLCFTFPLISSPSLNSIFMGGCISWFITVNHAEEDYCAGGAEFSPPLLPPGLPFPHMHLYHFEHYKPIQPRVIAAWHDDFLAEDHPDGGECLFWVTLE